MLGHLATQEWSLYSLDSQTKWQPLQFCGHNERRKMTTIFFPPPFSENSLSPPASLPAFTSTPTSPLFCCSPHPLVAIKSSAATDRMRVLCSGLTPSDVSMLSLFHPPSFRTISYLIFRKEEAFTILYLPGEKVLCMF